jgi:hypothetical protein
MAAADLAAPVPAEPSQLHERGEFLELLRQAACVEVRLLAVPPRSPARAALSARLQAALAVNDRGRRRWQSPAEVTEAQKRTTQQRKVPAQRPTVALHSAALRAEARAQRLEEARRQADAAAYLRRQQAANRAYGELARQRARQHIPPATTARPRWQSDATHDAPEELSWQPQRWSTSSDESTAWHDDDLSSLPTDDAVESREDDVSLVDGRAYTEMDDDLPPTPAEELSSPAVEVQDAAVQHSPARSVADVSTWTDTLPSAPQASAAPVGDHTLEASPVAEHILRRMRLQRHLHARPAVNLRNQSPAAAEKQQEDESPSLVEQHTQPSPGTGEMDARALIRRLLELSAPALRDGATSLPRTALNALGASQASVLPLYEAVNEAMALRLLGCSQLSREVWLHQLAHVDVADRMEAVVKHLGDRVDRWMACASVSTEEERLEMQHAVDLEADQRIWDDAVQRHYAQILEDAAAA